MREKLGQLVQIARDPFARTSLMRQAVQNKDLSIGCGWCGGRKKTLYRYGTEADDRGWLGFASGDFCNIGCYRSYHS